ncbi:MAG: energy-coupling factor transporter transmembrane component T [Syntrophomonas sp.]|nr:energy-coupling factor transporter transmembrane component T [Syntrophomonas sp.]
MQGMIIGQFVRGDSVIHRLDPRTKLLGCLAVIVAVAWPGQTISRLLLDAALIIALIHLSQLGILRVLGGLKSLRILFLLTFICQVFFTRGDPLLSWGGIIVSRAGVYLGIATFLRLVLLYLGASLLTMTTSSLKLSAGLESLLSPLAYLRFPVQQFAMIINISLRFIPTIIEEAEIIARAQRSRGARFDAGPLWLRLKTTVTILIPLLGASLQRANELALAMESRCYTSGSANHSRLNSLHYSWIDGMALMILTVHTGTVLMC